MPARKDKLVQPCWTAGWTSVRATWLLGGVYVLLSADREVQAHDLARAKHPGGGPADDVRAGDRTLRLPQREPDDALSGAATSAAATGAGACRPGSTARAAASD